MPMTKRRIRVLAVSFLAAAFAVTAGFAVQGHARAARYRLLADNSYRHAFTELVTAVGELDSALQKGTYASTSSLFSSLCTQAYGKALAAQTAIGELPYGSVELEQTAAFLAKAGDYAMALSRGAWQNEVCTAEERETLRGLSAAAGELYATLQALESELYAGTVEAEDLAAVQHRLSRAMEDGTVTAGSVFQDVEADFPEVPTLVYDGPFSEHLTNRTPKMLEGMPQADEAAAREAAASFLDLKPEIFTLASAGEGALPTYGFSALVDGGTVWVEVTRTGAQVLSVINDRPVGEAVLSAEEGQAQAAAFLSEHGFPDMAPSYYIQRDNVLTVNFAAVQDGVVCYPDLVKVSVALDGGRIVGFEDHGYLMNHGSRDLAQPTVSLARAQAAVGDGLSILAHQMAVIPTSGQYEVLCHEFKCRREDGGHALVYIDAFTGQERQILLLLEDETGTLVL